MEAVIFVGIQGAGKSTFFKQRFADTHIRINLDMLGTKHREKLILEACLTAGQRFVVDKINLTRDQRQPYIEGARAHGFRTVGYYFRTDVAGALERNGRREGKARVPDKGLLGAVKNLEIPRLDEGFDELMYVRIDDQNCFVVEPWQDEV